MTSGDSDIEISSAIPKKKILKKAPQSPTAGMHKLEKTKKASVKTMVHKALTDLKTRKGVSLHAIKKYMEDYYKVDAEKIKHFIKKYIKAAVENGSIIQTKGIGASGSFRLAAVKEKMEKRKDTIKTNRIQIGKEKPTDEKKEKKKKETKSKEKGETTKKTAEKKKTDTKVKKIMKKPKETTTNATEDSKTKEKKKKVNMVQKPVKEKVKSAKTPKKKAAMTKRKSIGSIIKPPKMKPKKV